MTRTITETAVVSGTHRYKYFKRPIMPKVNAYPPQILLAPTTAGKEENNPLIPIHEEVEKTVKDAGIQTLYRESEAQTVPYTPEYVLPPGVTEPEVLLLKNLTYEDGLPLGSKEMDMIEYARAKHEMECNLPPFTDEASLLLRKRLMEQAEMREFKLREAEIDNARNEKLDNLSQMLQDREESHEFMTSQIIVWDAYRGMVELILEEQIPYVSTFLAVLFIFAPIIFQFHRMNVSVQILIIGLRLISLMLCYLLI